VLWASYWAVRPSSSVVPPRWSRRFVAAAQARVKARQITANVREKAKDLQRRGQDMLDEQVARVSAVVEAGKTAVQGS